jgi:hypothetical protein
MPSTVDANGDVVGAPARFSSGRGSESDDDDVEDGDHVREQGEKEDDDEAYDDDDDGDDDDDDDDEEEEEEEAEVRFWQSSARSLHTPFAAVLLALRSCVVALSRFRWT